MPRALPILLLCALAPAARAGGEPPRSIHDPTGYAPVWNQPGAERAKLRAGIVFGRPRDRDLSLDLYAPADAPPGERRPTVVFLSGAGDDPAAPLRSWEIYRGWMRTVAARGYVGVMGESDPRDVPGSLSALFGFLARQGGELGIDTDRLLAWAASANVGGALPFLMGEGSPPGLLAAVLLYGAGDTPHLRADLPVLLVIAGRDAPELVQAERAMAERARGAGAPWTVAEAPELPHAFDAFDRSRRSLTTLAQVLGFLDAQLGTPPPPAPESEPRRAAREALRRLYGQEFEAAREYYDPLVEGPAAEDPQAWENLAWARRGLGSPVGEMLALEQALRLSPADWDLRRRFTRLAARLGGWAQVEAGLAPVAGDARLDAVDLGILGRARLHLGRPAEAIAPLERAVALGGEPGTRYNLACARSLAGDLDGALAALAGALDAGFDRGELLASDPDLEALRSDPRFEALRRRVAGPPPAREP